LAHRAEHPRRHGRDGRRLPGPGLAGGRHGAARRIPRVLSWVAPCPSRRLRRRAVGAPAGRHPPDPAAVGARRAERPVRVTSPPPGSSWFGHPRGLSTLFFTEMWERFSYYGMRGFLILYMTKALGFTDPHAGAVYGNYVGSVWLAAIFGGVIADRWLGHYRSVLLGGIVIALGHFTLALHALPFFYAGLSLIVVGTGLLKPNVSTLVGSLYEQGDERRDAGFSVFYMGINLGALLGPVIAGKLAEGVDWHLGFACAGVGMTLGLVQYVLARGRVQAAFVILRFPVFAWLWVQLGPRQPSSPEKFALALLFVGLAFVLLMPAGAIAQGGVKISPLWLVAVYFIEELGELCLSPVGLSVVTKLAPRQVVGLMMGVFFLSNALGNKLAGWSAGFISTTPLPTLFGVTASVTLGAAAEA